MTHFEYVSVAVALILSLVVSRLLSGVTAATRPDRASWIHLFWLTQNLIAVVVLWWGFWNVRLGDWTATRFGWALLLPAIMYVKAHVLVGAAPDSIASFEDHFFANRARFFAIGLLGALVTTFTPLVNGAPVDVFRDVLPLSAVAVGSHAGGLISRSRRVHAVLAVAMLTFSAAALFLMPVGLAAE